jgi:putative hydrolase of the HAD superfamily
MSATNRKILAVLLDCGDTLIDEATQEFGESDFALRAALIPGAGELVRALKQRAYPLALVADGPSQTFRNLLGQHGLFDLFDVRAISQEVGVDKPHPAMFRAALDALGILPERYGQVVMVGNNLERDIKGANALGLLSVWIDWAPRRAKVPADPSEQPRYTIKMPLELLPLLEALENTGAGDLPVEKG